jgi:hypothetical protein
MIASSPTEISDNDYNDERVATRPTSKRDQIVARLRAFTKYGAGWDGDQALPPSKSAIEDAINLVANLTMDVLFVAVPEPEGAIDLIAQDHGKKVILVVEGNHKVSIFVREPSKDLYHQEFDIPRFIGADRRFEQVVRAALT